MEKLGGGVKQWLTGIPVPGPGRYRDWHFDPGPGPGQILKITGILTGIEKTNMDI